MKKSKKLKNHGTELAQAREPIGHVKQYEGKKTIEGIRAEIRKLLEKESKEKR
jgi:hypothetical protein